MPSQSYSNRRCVLGIANLRGRTSSKSYLVPILPPGSATVTSNATYWESTAFGIRQTEIQITSPPLTSFLTRVSYFSARQSSWG